MAQADGVLGQCGDRKAVVSRTCLVRLGSVPSTGVIRSRFILSSTTDWTLPQPWAEEHRPPLLGNSRAVSTSPHRFRASRNRRKDRLRRRRQCRRGQLLDRLGAGVGTLGHGPLVVLLRAGWPRPGGSLTAASEDADDVRPPLDLFCSAVPAACRRCSMGRCPYARMSSSASWSRAAACANRPRRPSATFRSCVMSELTRSVGCLRDLMRKRSV
jgi:hypothetical protein